MEFEICSELWLKKMLEKYNCCPTETSRSATLYVNRSKYIRMVNQVMGLYACVSQDGTGHIVVLIRTVISVSIHTTNSETRSYDNEVTYYCLRYASLKKCALNKVVYETLGRFRDTT